MKYWKGKGIKSGKFGTMDDSGSVPDSDICLKSEYDAFVALIPVLPIKKELKDVLLSKGIITQTNYDEVK